MCASSPERIPKLQLTAEQLSTGEYWIRPKKIPQKKIPLRAKDKPQKDSLESHLESNPIPTRDAWRAQTNLREPTENEPDLLLSV